MINIVRISDYNYHAFDSQIRRIVKDYLIKLEKFDYILLPTENNVDAIINNIILNNNFNLNLANVNRNGIVTDIVVCFESPYSGFDVKYKELNIFMQWADDNLHVRGISNDFLSYIKKLGKANGFDYAITTVDSNNIGKITSIENMDGVSRKFITYKQLF